MASQDTSRYHLPPPAEEDSRDSSPHDTLLPRTSLHKYPNSWSITLGPILVLRTLTFILSLVAFIIFVIDGGDAFIAADIFLAFLMIINAVSLTHYSISHIVKVTVEVRQNSFALGNQKGSNSNSNSSPNTKSVVRFLDLLSAFALALSLIIGSAVTRRWGGAWHAAVVLGYFVVVMQVAVVVPAMESKSVTVTFRLNDRQGKNVADMKLPSHVASASGGADIGAARRRTAEAEEPRQTAEDLV